MIETDARTAESLVLAGDPDAALEVANEAGARSSQRGGVTAQDPLIHRSRGYAHLQRGELDAARAALEQALAAAESRRADYERALTLLALSEVAAHGEGASSRLLTEARQVLDDLGVEWLPAVPSDGDREAPSAATSSPGRRPAAGS